MKRLLVEKMKDYRNHRIIGPPAIHPCGDNKRMMVTEHKVAVPLLYNDLEAALRLKSDSIIPVDRVDGGYNSNESFDRPTIDVYFTITELVSNSADEKFFDSLSNLALTPRQRADLYLQRDGSTSIDASRCILYLQGGPGFGCAAPVSGLSLASSKSSWAASALFGDITNTDDKTFERIILMDQRGTGKSSPITKQRLQKMFPDLFLLDEESGSEATAELQLKRAKVSKAVVDATEYLSMLRADSIVRDAEWIKSVLTQPHTTTTMEGDVPEEDNLPQPWGAALGQSFGGFCLMTYLSSIKHPPKLCLFTGGIAPMNTPVREVYDRLWLRVKERNLRYYEQYPGDVAMVKRIVQRLLLQESDPSQPPVKLPSGGILTARRFLQLGLALGGSPGTSVANIHSILNSAFLGEEDDELTTAFLKRIDYEQSFDDAPLYFLLHESIYADGPSSGATNWAAHSSYEHYITTNPEFDYRVTSESNEGSPTLFFGEMVFPWMAQGEFAEVSGHGMKSLAESLAAKSDWLPLFDASNMRAALGTSTAGTKSIKCKAASATYFDDMYVDFNCAMSLLQRGSPLEGTKVWVTNEYQHSGLRDDGATIVCKLVKMAKGQINVPS